MVALEMIWGTRIAQKKLICADGKNLGFSLQLRVSA